MEKRGEGTTSSRRCLVTALVLGLTVTGFVHANGQGEAEPLVAPEEFEQRTGSGNPLSAARGFQPDGALPYAAFGDVDGDGDVDLVPGEVDLETGTGRLSYYENAGAPNAPDFVRQAASHPLAGPVATIASPARGHRGFGDQRRGAAVRTPLPERRRTRCSRPHRRRPPGYGKRGTRTGQLDSLLPERRRCHCPSFGEALVTADGNPYPLNDERHLVGGTLDPATQVELKADDLAALGADSGGRRSVAVSGTGPPRRPARLLCPGGL